MEVCNRNLTWSDLNCKGVDGSSTSFAGEALLVINLQTFFKTDSISTFIPFEICEFSINKNNSTYFMQLICVMNNIYYDVILSQYIYCETGLHKLWYPGIRDRSTWGKFGAHGEHGDVFLFSNLGAL